MGGTRERPVGEGGHIIEDEGIPLAQRAALNFLGTGVTAVDAPGKTNVTIPGGGGGGDVTFELLKTINLGADIATATITLDTPVDFADYSEFVFVVSGILRDAVGNIQLQMNGDVNSIYSYAGAITTESPTAVAGFTSPTSTTLEMSFGTIQQDSPFYMKWIIEGGAILDANSKRQGSGELAYVEDVTGLFAASRGMTMINPIVATQLSSISVLAVGIGVPTVGQNSILTIYGKKLVGSGGGGTGHIIEDETVPLPTQPALNFEGAGVTVTNDIPNSATLVTIPGGAGSGNWEKVGDVTVSGGAVNSVNVNLSRTVAIDGTDVSMLVAVVHVKPNATVSIGYRYNNITTGGYSCNGNDLGGGSYTSFTETGNEIFTDKAYGIDGMFAILELSGQTNGSKVMGHIREAGDGVTEATIGHYSINTTVTSVTSFQILTIDSLLKIADGTRIVIYAVTLTGGGGGGGNGHVIEDEGTPLAQQADLNFVGAGVTAADIGGKTVVTIPGGAGIEGHVIEDEGTPVAQQADLNFIGAGVTVVDSGGKTLVSIPGISAAFYQTVDDEGTPLPQQDNLNFVGAGVTVTDTGGKTVVNIPGGGGGTGSVIGSVITGSLVNSVNIVLSETIPFDGTVAEIELVATVSIDTTPDSLQVTINNDVGAVYDTTLVKVSTAGAVTGSHVAAATSFGSGETVAIGGFMSMLRIVFGVGSNLGGDRPAIEFFETCGGPPPPSTVVYREGRGIHVGSLANITSIQVKTASGNNFVIGSQFTVFKRVDVAAGGSGGSGVFDPFTVEPETYHYWYDEFYYPDPNTTASNFHYERIGNQPFVVPISTTGGVIDQVTPNSINGVSGIRTCGGGLVAVNGDDKFKVVWTIRNNSALATTAQRIGLFPEGLNPAGTFPFSSEPTPYFFFARDGAANWFAETHNGSTQVSLDTGVAGDLLFHTFEISFDPTGTPTVTFKIDGNIVAISTTFIPTGNFAVGEVVQTSDAAFKNHSIDTLLIVNGDSPVGSAGDVVTPFDAKTTALLDDEFFYQNGGAIQNKYNFSGANTPVLTNVQSNYGRASCEVGTGTGNFVQLDTRTAFSIDSSASNLIYKTKMIVLMDDMTGNHSFLSGFASVASTDKGSTAVSMMAAIEFGFGFFVDINDNQNWKVYLNTDITQQITDTGINAPSGADMYIEAEYVKATGVCTFKIQVVGGGSGTFQLTDTNLKDELILFAYARQLVAGTTRFEIDYWSMEAVRTGFA